MLLKNILKKENNNIDIFRLLASLMVIYGHAYALLPMQGGRDFLGKLLAFDYSGSLAVKVFFFLSGLVVTNSLIEKKNILQFSISRIFRVWPALIAVLLSTSIIFGLILSTDSLREYFSKKEVYEYALGGVLMNITFSLPGVFKANPLDAVNGSLWSIPFEVFAYFALAALFLIGFFKSKIPATLLFIVILIDPLCGNKILFTWPPENAGVPLLAPCFAFGSLLALWKDKINFDTKFIVGSWILFFLFKKSSYNFYFFYFSTFSTILYLSSRHWMLRLKPSIDISYGIYLWGWPIQQLMVMLFPDHGIRFNQISSIAIAVFFGLASWHLIEKHFIRIGGSLASRSLGYSNYFFKNSKPGI